mgnify:CR=1 FL=1
MARHQLSGNQSTVEVGSDHVNRLSIVFASSEGPGRNFSVSGRHPALAGEVAAGSNQRRRLGVGDSTASGLLDDPGPVGTPARAHPNILDRHLFEVGPLQEGGGVTFVTDADVAVLPADPETAELVAVEVSGGVGFGDLGFGTVLADYGFRVAPAADEYFVHRGGFGGRRAEGDVGIVRRTHSELEQARSVREEGVFESVFGLQFWNKKKLYFCKKLV